MEYKNWQFNVDTAGIGWLCFNKENSAVNTLGTAVVQELHLFLDELHAMPTPPKALVIFSSKETGFCMGADINEFQQEVDLEVMRQYVIAGQKVMQKIADLNLPTIALIHGFCLGGGLELALACDYRIAQQDGNTQMGLPEVKLGLQPAWGGSVRLTRLIHPLKALNLMLTGRIQDAVAAQRVGLVDVVVPERQMRHAAQHVASNPPKSRPFQALALLFRVKMIRTLFAALMKKQVKKQASPEHYPAPFMIIENWRRFGVCHEAAYAGEVTGFIDLLATSSAKNLIRLFFLQENLKAAGKKIKWQAKHVHVIGAGVMGGDIAAWCMHKGLTVTLQDRSAEDLCSAMKRVWQLCKQKARDKRDCMYATDRLIPDVKGEGLAKADIIIEAIVENAEIKKELLRNIEARMKPGAIIASNTSSIPLADLKVALSQPQQLVGLHFFNPVAKMQLVEVVHTQSTAQEAHAQALAFVRQIGKLPLSVKDCPGFLVNRVAVPQLLEVTYLLGQGVPMQQLDRIAQDFGMFMGPVALMDMVGLDICLAVVKNLTAQMPPLLVDKVNAKQLGKKTGQGFYRYKNGKIQFSRGEALPAGITAEEVIDRLILPVINECVACLDEKIVASIDDIDAGVIFGTGFAPFTGGPMQYAKTQGYRKIYEKLKTYEAQCGSRFTPVKGWDALLAL